MPVLFSILLSAVGFVVGRYTEDPKEIVQVLDDQYAALWNIKDFEGLVKTLYHEGALVIPPDASGFVVYKNLVKLLKKNKKYWNNTLNMTAEVVLKEQGTESNTIHEIGSYTGVSNKYYQRWSDAGGSWKIAFSSFAIGGPQGSSSTSEHMDVKSDPNQIITALDKKLADAFNNESFDAVALLYNTGAHLIPPTCDQFVPQTQLADFFKGVYDSGVTHIDVYPTRVIQESSTLIHEIGALSINSGPAAPYYVRWINNGTDWQLVTDIMAIGY